MTTMRDLAGFVFGRLAVISRVENTTAGKAVWLCRCECGNTTRVVGAGLTKGSTQSCGCLHREGLSRLMTTHASTGTPEYRIFHGMRNRCYNPNNSSFKNYGGRGITVEWKTMEEFLRAVGPRPTSRHTIERKNNDGPYSTENCVWATMAEQANNKRNNALIHYQGRTQTLAQWCKELSLDYGRTKHRFYRGKTIEEAFHK